jgi:membrane-bound hydrogenase subunit beta
MDENQLIEDIKEELGIDLLEHYIQRKRRVFIRINKDANRKMAKLITDKYNGFLSVMSSVDAGDDLELIYHFAVEGEEGRQINLNVTVSAPKDVPEIKTITDIIPGATFPEREAQDMVGLKIVGLPDPSRLFLSEDWPEGVYPLRKY